MKHFLEENNFNKEQIETVFKQAFEFKNTRKQRPTKGQRRSNHQKRN